MILHTWEWCSPGCDICVVCGVQQTADNPVSPECSGKTHKPSDVVVSRTDLEWAMRLIHNVYTATWPNAKEVPYVEFDRLRAVLNQEGTQ